MMTQKRTTRTICIFDPYITTYLATTKLILMMSHTTSDVVCDASFQLCSSVMWHSSQQNKLSVNQFQFPGPRSNLA